MYSSLSLAIVGLLTLGRKKTGWLAHVITIDHKHHPTDVIAGALIGTIIQLFNVAYVTKIWASVSTPAGPRMERNEVDINNGVPLQERTSNNTLL